MIILRSIWYLLFIFIMSGAVQADEHMTDHAVIITYHHVSESTPASTSVTPAQFAAHLDYIETNGYIVWPLRRLVERLRAGQLVPDKVVTLTFDDAYRSVFTQARPMLRARRWPYTVFVSTQAIDHNVRTNMSWDQLRTLVAEGVEIGNHSHSHPYMVRHRTNEDEDKWRLRVRSEVETAQARFKKELDYSPTLFAYPYGEYSLALAAEIKAMGLIGFGQHSGAIGFESDYNALPRFPFGGNYADLELLAIRLNTRPLTIRANPVGPLGDTSNRRPELLLTVKPGPYLPQRLACYASGQGRMLLEATTDEWKFRLKPEKPLNAGRNKYNCTIPHINNSDEFYWWSYLLLIPTAANEPE